MTKQGNEDGMGPFHWFMPTKLIFGIDRIATIGEEAKKLGHHVLLVAAYESMDKIGALEKVRQSLEKADVKVTVFPEVQPNPTVPDIDKVGTLCSKKICDLVIGLGGGSTIDFAKGVAIVASHGGSIWDYIRRPDYTPKEVTSKTLPIIAIPTTSGTGSEVTQVSVISNLETRQKPGIVSQYIFPKMAIVDPLLTIPLPAKLTAGTGFDALAHSVEAFVSKVTSPFADLIALEGIRLVFENLKKAVFNGNDLAAREKLAWAATLGGVAIGHAGMTVTHGMAEVLGGRFNLPHGEAVSICLPEVLKRIWTNRKKRFIQMANVIGVAHKESSEDKQIQACLKAFEKLTEEVGLKMHLRDFGVSKEDAKQLSADIFNYKRFYLDVHPLPVTPQDLEEMFLAVW